MYQSISWISLYSVYKLRGVNIKVPRADKESDWLRAKNTKNYDDFLNTLARNAGQDLSLNYIGWKGVLVSSGMNPYLTSTFFIIVS